MSRKDTIMIAVLVNACLLIALFASAIRKEPTQTEPKQVAVSTPLKMPERKIKVAAGDEIDQVLREFSQKTMARQAEDEAPSKQKIDFAKELQALSKTPTPTPKKEYVEVVVKKGDALEKIARANQTTVKEIMELNGMRSTILRIGQVLKMPKKAGATTTQSTGEYYTVRQGDNPWTIAVKNQIKVNELLELNNLDERKARQLKPGDRLRIR